ncbi:MAG: ABC transporter permease [Hyphomicrobiales bacterium]|nr:ABC transporter permease [Hyphomicrobiales bacterium]
MLGARPAETPLVPPETIAGRALVFVVAIMTFLAALAMGGAILVSQASADWRSAVSRETTVQVMPAPGRNIETDVGAAQELLADTPGVAEARAMSKAESEKLLEPWLGGGLNLDDLAVPRMIVVKLSGAPIDLVDIQARLSRVAPTATLDDHRMWSERLARMANALVMVAILLLALVLTAMTVAVYFATRGAMAGAKDIIEVLHFTGATDGYISREFQRHVLGLSTRGAMIGGGLAGAFFYLAGLFSRRLTASPGGQVEALFGSFSIGWLGYFAIAIIALASAAIAGLTSRIVVFHRLRNLS